MHSWRMSRTTFALVIGGAVAATVLQAPALGDGSVSAPGLDVSVPAKPRTDVEQTKVPVVADVAPQSSGDEVVAELKPTEVDSFGFVGVTWAAGDALKDVHVTVRTKAGETWSGWKELELEDDTGNEGGRPGTEGVWVGKADGVAARVTTASGTPHDVRIVTIDGGDEPTPTAVKPVLAPLSDGTADATPAYDEGSPSYTAIPKIITRAQWGAKAGTTCDSPTVGSTTKGIVVHHTAGSNSYTAAESASIVRAAQAYHINGHGWCDIGYNFLVDKYGQIFEGRKGGVDRNVRAAHSGNDAVNTYTTGISMMGTFTTTTPSAALKTAMVKLVGYRLGTTYQKAKGTYSLGGLTLNKIAGHRNVVGTACPGQAAYNWLSVENGLRDRVEDYIASYSTPMKTLAAKLGSDKLGTIRIGENEIRGGGHRAIFAKGDLYTSSHGTFAVLSPVLSKYAELNRSYGKLGYPTGDYKTTAAGGAQTFEGGRLVYSSSTRKVTAEYGEPTSTPTPDEVTVPSTRKVTLDGHGFGHGKGMSQYGAQGASTSGLAYGKILYYYYPGTQLGDYHTTLRVLITKDTSTDVIATAYSGMRFRLLSTGTLTALPAEVGGQRVTQWRMAVRNSNPTQTVLMYRTASSSWAWYKSTAWTGPAQLERNGFMGLVLPGGKNVRYRGALRSSPPSAGSTTRDTINVVELDQYVMGVVANEMPSTWRTTALQAQATAARTYAAASKRPGEYYDLCDTTSCQVYGGVDSGTSRTDEVVKQTSHKILYYDGKPALTQFSSSSGGWTADGGKPYLTAHSDGYDDDVPNPNHSWSKTISASTLEHAYPSIGTLRSLRITNRNGHGDWGGRVVSMTLVGSKGSTTISGDKARSVLSLKSNWFAFH